MLIRNRWEGRSGREMNARATDLAYVLRTRTDDTIFASGMHTPSGGILLPASSSRFRCRFSAFPPNSTTVLPLHFARSQQSREDEEDRTASQPKAIGGRGSADEWPVLDHSTRGGNMDISSSIHDLVAATLTELGLPAPSNMIQTMLMKDRYFVGHKFRYDGGYPTTHETCVIARTGEYPLWNPMPASPRFPNRSQDQSPSPTTISNPSLCRNYRQGWGRRRTASVKPRHRNG